MAFAAVSVGWARNAGGLDWWGRVWDAESAGLMRGTDLS